jgi:membrane fusion protein, macrolide-specific efflux system
MRKSHVAIILAVLVAGAIGWAALARDEPSAPPVVTKAEQGSVVVTVLASGMLEATQLVSVGARVSGQVETLAVALGQQVSEGDLIAQIDSQDQKNTLLQAKASLVNINAQIAAKEATLARAPFHAVVRGIEPAPTEIADSDTISSSSAIYYNGLLEVAKSDGKLRIGMTAEVSIELARADGVLTVPSAALKKDATGT